MVIIAILSVAAAIIVPRFLQHQGHARQEECLKNLKSLQSKEVEYFAKNHTYTEDLTTLGWEKMGKGWYQYRFLPASPLQTTFLFDCVGNIDHDETVDEATINEKGEITSLSDDTKK